MIDTFGKDAPAYMKKIPYKIFRFVVALDDWSDVLKYAMPIVE